MNCLEAAHKYLDMGWTPIPIGAGKVPNIKWQEFQSRRPSVPEIDTWFSDIPDSRVGIITGRLSGGAALFSPIGPRETTALGMMTASLARLSRRDRMTKSICPHCLAGEEQPKTRSAFLILQIRPIIHTCPETGCITVVVTRGNRK
jgi:hypothetical protein